MANIFGPILPLQLDSRNTEALVRAIQTKIFLESGGELNDFTSASPLAAISEGQAFAQAELLYYLNNLPEAFSLQWLRQLGIQRKIGSKALVDVTFYKVPGFQRAVVIPPGTRVLSNSGLAYLTLDEVRITGDSFSSTVSCQSERWGSIYNVNAEEINKIEKNFLGLESLSNQEPAVGGSDIESVDQMKQRAFEVLSRRNLTTTIDFENEIKFLAPDSSLVKVLTYEERNQLSSLLSGNVIICLGDQNGQPLPEASQSLILQSLRNRVTIGTNVSLVPPDIVPLDVVVEVYYDPNNLEAGTDFYASEVFNLIRNYFDEISSQLGSEISYQNVLRQLYTFDFIKSVNTLDIKLMIKNPEIIEGICAGFTGEESEDNTKCFFSYSQVISADSQELEVAPSPITSYKLYRAEIAFTSINDFSSLTYFYEDLYTP